MDLTNKFYKNHCELELVEYKIIKKFSYHQKLDSINIKFINSPK